MASWTSQSTPSGAWERSLLQTSTTKEGLSKAAGEGPAYCSVLHGFSASVSFLLDDSLLQGQVRGGSRQHCYLAASIL